MMMPNAAFDNLRQLYKPDKVDVLFIGESRPQGGTFFYQADSSLYRETKKAFDDYFKQEIFSLDSFKKWNCWFYDICEIPVNGLDNAERSACIRESMQGLIDVINKEKPRLLIVCKKTFVEPEIKISCIMNSFADGQSIFFLSHPAYGNQKKYREGLIKALKVTDFKRFVTGK